MSSMRRIPVPILFIGLLLIRENLTSPTSLKVGGLYESEELPPQPTATVTATAAVMKMLLYFPIIKTQSNDYCVWPFLIIRNNSQQKEPLSRQQLRLSFYELSYREFNPDYDRVPIFRYHESALVYEIFL